MIFPQSLPFIMSRMFLFFPIGSGLLSSFGYLLVSDLVFTSFVMSVCKNLLPLYHTKSCLRPYSIALHDFHTWAFFSHSKIHILASCLGPILLVHCLFILISVFPISTANSSFENGYPSLKFGFTTYLAYLSLLVISFMSLWFLIFSMVFPKMLLLSNSFFAAVFGVVFNIIKGFIQ